MQIPGEDLTTTIVRWAVKMAIFLIEFRTRTASFYMYGHRLHVHMQSKQDYLGVFAKCVQNECGYGASERKNLT